MTLSSPQAGRAKDMLLSTGSQGAAESGAMTSRQQGTSTVASCIGRPHRLCVLRLAHMTQLLGWRKATRASDRAVRNLVPLRLADKSSGKKSKTFLSKLKNTFSKKHSDSTPIG